MLIAGIFSGEHAIPADSMNRRVLYPFWTWCWWVLILPLAAVLFGLGLIGFTEIGNFPFDHLDSNWLWLVAVVPLAGSLFLYGLARRRRSLERFASVSLAPLLAARLSPERQAMRAGLGVWAVAFLLAAIVGPRWGTYLDKQKVHGFDVVVALDVSRSMLARDLEPNRLEYAKQAIRQQLLERPRFAESNRVALLAFAGSTSLKVPLTTDRLTFRNKLDMVRVGSAPRGGTAIAQAIRAAADLFVKSPEEATKMILVFTDGEDHEGGPVEAAEEVYRDKNILVYTIGVGDPSRTVGAEVPTVEGPGAKPILYDGQFVFSKLDEPGLRRIAEAGGGRCVPVKDLHLLVNTIAGMRKSELSVEERLRYKPQYQWFVAAALFCLGLETTLRDRRKSVEGLPQRVWQAEAA
jgi:Ca-activated chloride channel family protein